MSPTDLLNLRRRRCFFLLGAGLVGGWHTERAEARPPAASRPAIPLALEAPAGIDPAGYLVSEKFDGVRALWDGQTLRFRSGLPVAAPAWFLDRLPPIALDGELWLGRGQFQTLSGAVRRLRPDDAEWSALRYMVFELPDGPARFADRAAALQALVARVGWPALQAVTQQALTDRTALQRRLQAVLAGGGEGLMLRHVDAPYASGRSAALLKLKPLQDAEAQVVDHVPGRGKHAGRLGALRVRTEDGHEFLLGTGFSDAQREVPPAIGQWVTYSHRGRTESGLPRFASFVRERSAGL